MNEAANPFDGTQFMELLRGLEHRKIPFQVESRDLNCCVGIAVRFAFGLRVWEVIFFENDHIEVLKFYLSGDVESVVSVRSLLADVDAKIQI